LYFILFFDVLKCLKVKINGDGDYKKQIDFAIVPVLGIFCHANNLSWFAVSYAIDCYERQSFPHGSVTFFKLEAQRAKDSSYT
jgi:hypothetical protein